MNQVEALIAQARAEARVALSEIESKRLLATIGLPVAAAYEARTAGEAARLAAQVGLPVALKVLSPEVSHKSDVGGVALNLKSQAQVRRAFAEIRRKLGELRPQARFAGVNVQKMARSGIEMLAGIVRDQCFGPLVMVGLGGVLVELFSDTAMRTAPLDEEEARAMIDELRGVALLRGARGLPSADIGALAALLVKLGQLAADRPELKEIDLNPVVVHAEGLMVLDARVVLAGAGDGAASGENRSRAEPGAVFHPSSPPAAPESVPAVMGDLRRPQRLENLRRGFDPRVVAVIGDKRLGGFMWLRALARFNGKLCSVQIDPDEIAGIEAMGVKNYRSLDEIEEEIDYAIVAVPRQVAPRILHDCIAKGVRCVAFFSSGFAETGEEAGAKLERELKALAGASDIALVGPNCMGLYNPAAGLRNFPELGVGGAGEVCFISQSGTHAINFSLQAAARGLKINKVASIGNSIVLEATDYLELMAQEPATRVLGAYIEGVREGRRFLETLRRAAARFPVVIWKGGTTEAGARATRSHTGALATSAAIWRTAIRQSGAVEVASLDAMLDAVELFSRGRAVKGKRMGLVAMTGGQSVMITDAFADAGLEVPMLSADSYEKLGGFFNVIGGSYKNPLDAGGTIGMGHEQGRLGRILDILERDPVIDAVVLEIATGLRAARWSAHEDELTELLDRLQEFNRRSLKPLVVVLHPAHLESVVAHAKGLARERGLVVLDSFERAARALKLAADYWAGKTRASDEDGRRTAAL